MKNDLENFVRGINKTADETRKKLRDNPDSPDRFEMGMRALLSVSSETKSMLGISPGKRDEAGSQKIHEIMAELNCYDEGCSACLDELISNVKNKRKTEKFALFGEFYPRGILCPSPIMEYLYYPKRSRGRFACKLPKRRPHWIYYYDDSDDLIGTEFFGCEGKCAEPIFDDIAFGDTSHTFELIRNSENRQLGVSYDDRGILTAASYFETDNGKPLIYCHFKQLHGRMFTCNYEKYTYTGSEITGLELLFEATVILKTNELFSTCFDRKRVDRDEKGYLFFPERKWLDGYGENN